MLNDLPQKIKKMRLERKLSQEEISQKLGMSRPTYMQVEKGGRDLTIEEARKLASVFGLTLENFLNERGNVNFVLEKPQKEMPKQDIRILIPRAKVDKFREILLYILAKVGSKPNVGESVINKLLYFVDFDYYEKYEEQIIGATYIKNYFGPTPCELLKITEDMKSRGEIEEVRSKFYQYDQKKFLPLRNPRLETLTAREIEHVDDVLNRLSDKTASELSNYSHEDIPWKVHKEGEKISYESVFYRDDKHSVRNYEDEL